MDHDELISDEDDEHRFNVTEDGKLEENEEADADFEENLTFDD